MSLSNFLEGELLDHLFDIGAYSAPSIYVALFTDDPGDDGSGTEVSGGSYARVEVTTWSRSGNEVDNDSEISFPEATDDWGTVTHVALYDALSGGNILASAELDSPQAVDSGDTARFAAGELTISLD